MISLVCNENEWTTYVRIMIKSEIHGIEFVARMVGWNNANDESSRSLTLPKAVDEQGVKCGIAYATITRMSEQQLCS
jgi:hypothetical protein